MKSTKKFCSVNEIFFRVNANPIDSFGKIMLRKLFDTLIL